MIPTSKFLRVENVQCLIVRLKAKDSYTENHTPQLWGYPAECVGSATETQTKPKSELTKAAAVARSVAPAAPRQR